MPLVILIMCKIQSKGQKCINATAWASDAKYVCTCSQTQGIGWYLTNKTICANLRKKVACISDSDLQRILEINMIKSEWWNFCHFLSSWSWASVLTQALTSVSPSSFATFPLFRTTSCWENLGTLNWRRVCDQTIQRAQTRMNKHEKKRQLT